METRGIAWRLLATLVALPLGFSVVPTFGADIAPDAEDAPRLAIEGFDIVAYHDEGGPIHGKFECQTVWHDARWPFASEENLDIFVKNPATYVEHLDDPIDAR